jgi:hypothetical protein
MNRATLQTEILALGHEWPATIDYAWTPAEPMTHDHPGCPAEIEITGLTVAGIKCDVAALDPEEDATIISRIKQHIKRTGE